MTLWKLRPALYHGWNIYCGGSWEAKFRTKERAEQFIELMNQEKEDDNHTERVSELPNSDGSD